ncbi:hypothetical protein L227DRAFT_653881 [Lentinus tigrinus ALCF2SS1-6]|uniref:Uncharacterized protein n=1 Tax=Lentinus tigrinus ALCF2SS1-6 TaxID=1328759 RepID=A0A5C2S6V9_9APHY|nr:hypothetical protein L227DRAFT_653881 [Lentinus tigrinus ALCF2SS1-6]
MALGISYQDIMRSLIGPGGCATDSLFAIRPAHDSRNPHCDAFVCDFKSRRIARDAERMFFAFPPQTVECPSADAKHRELFKACWKGQRTSVLARCLFVNIARHALLGHSDPPLQLSAMFATDGTSSVWRPSSETSLRALSLPLRSAEAYGSSRSPIDEGHVYLPAAPSRAVTPTCDAFFFDSEIGSAQRVNLWILQSTVSATCKTKSDSAIRLRRLITAARTHCLHTAQNNRASRKRKRDSGDAVTVCLNLVLVHPDVQDRNWSWEMPVDWIEDWQDMRCEPHVYHMPLSI